VDRFGATLCFLLAAGALAVALFGAIDFTRGCAAFRHKCFYIALAAPALLVAAIIAGGAGWLLWPRRREIDITRRPPNER
jgi:hypothetical protein